MSNGAQLASGLARYRTVRELGSRSPRSYAAFREPNELVVIHRYVRATEAKAKASGGAFVGSDGQVSLGSEAMGLLLRDARCLAKNWHPNIARVRHVDLIGEDLTIATELLDGATLADLFVAAAAKRGQGGEREASGPPLPLPVIARILVDVLAGLHGLHALRDGKNVPLGSIHGAGCPANVVVGKDGVARLVNALRTRPVRVGAFSEAVGYGAPEALDVDGTSDPRADVHAAGVMLWEALMGRRLYEETDPLRVLARQRQDDIEAPRCPPDSPFARLPEIAMRALAFDPALRFKTAAEMSAALRTAAGTHIATGSVVAACVAELAGERIRARRAELDPTGPGARHSSDRLQRVAVATEEAAGAVTAPPPVAVTPDSRPALVVEQTVPQPPTVPVAFTPVGVTTSAVTRPPRLGTSPDLSMSAELTGTFEHTAPTDLSAAPEFAAAERAAPELAAPAAAAAAPAEGTFAPIVDPARHEPPISSRPREMPAGRRTAIVVMLGWAIALVLVLAGISVRTLITRRTPKPVAEPAMPTTEVRSNAVIEPAASAEPAPEAEPTPLASASTDTAARAQGSAAVTNAPPKLTTPTPGKGGEPTKAGSQSPPRSKKSTYEPLGI